MTIERSLPDLARLPRPVYPRVEQLPADSLAARHRHPFAQLTYAASGVLIVRTAAGNFAAPPHRAVYVPAGMAHEVATSQRADMRSLYIDAAIPGFKADTCRVIEVSPLLRELLLAVTALPPEYDEAGPAGRLVAVLLDQLSAMPEAGLTLPLPADPRLGKLCAALQAAPDDRRGLPALAREAGMSERTLARAFLRETGMGFREWRRRMRLVTALLALENGVPVTRVALECGYEAPSAFIAAFRRQFGRTPGAFLKDGQNGRAGS